MAEVTVTRVTALYPDAVFVQWDIVPDEEGPHLVDVSRSGSPEGPWEPLASNLLNAYNVVDDKFNLPPPPLASDERGPSHLFSLNREIYYQVSVLPPSGEALRFTSDPAPIEPGLDTRTRLLKRKLLRDESVGFRTLNGIAIVVLKRRHWGTRCRNCYDPGLREGTLEHCPRCFATTFEGGYWAPVLIRGRRSPGPVQTQTTSHGKSEMKKVTFTILDYPHVEPDDLLIDLRRNDRFVIEIVSPTELKTVAVHQTITASEIARDAVEYQVPVDVETAPPLY